MSEGTVIFEILATAKGVKVVQKQTDDLAKSSDKASKSTDKLSKSRDAYHRKEKGAAQISSNQTKKILNKLNKCNKALTEEEAQAV